jgi:hypothetical protein
MQSLLTITLNATSGSAPLLIAKETIATVLSLLRNKTEDTSNIVETSRIRELALTIVLSISNSALLLRQTDNTLDLPSSGIDLSDIIYLAVEHMRTPQSTFSAHSLIVLTLGEIMRFQANLVFTNPSLVALLLASFRSNNLGMRAKAFVVLLGLCDPYAEEDRRHSPIALAFIALSDRQNMPPRVYPMDALQVDSETQRAFSAFINLVDAMRKVVRDKDLQSLGSTCYDLIMDTGDAIVDGNFRETPAGAEPLVPEGEQHGLAFDDWADALPYCAKALRVRGTPTDLDIADVLDLKNLLLDHDVVQAHRLADLAIRRNHDNAMD